MTAYLSNSGSTSAHSKQRPAVSSLLNGPQVVFLFFLWFFFFLCFSLSVNVHLPCQPTASLSSAGPYMENPPAGRWILRLGSGAGCDGASTRIGASIGGVRKRRRKRRRVGEKREETRCPFKKTGTQASRYEMLLTPRSWDQAEGRRGKWRSSSGGQGCWEAAGDISISIIGSKEPEGCTVEVVLEGKTWK